MWDLLKKLNPKVWERLDGYKTLIGLILVALAPIINTLHEVWIQETGLIAKVTQTMLIIGGALTGVGVGHKAIKSRDKQLEESTQKPP